MNSLPQKSNNLLKKFLWNLTRWVKHLLNHLRKITYDPSLKESILELLEEYSTDPKKEMPSAEKNILQNILEFDDLTVHELMTPRADIIAVSSKSSLTDIKNTIVQFEHTRIPVYQDSLDKIIGFIHVKDVLSEFFKQKKFDITKIIRKILVVSPSMQAIDLLAKMQSSRVHIAIVLDEYGGVDGLITIENLIEAIIGEIEDEHDGDETQDYIILKDSSIEASARLNIEKLEKLFNITLQREDEENDFDTVGGLVLSLISHVPIEGEIINHDSGLVFKILEADPRRIKRLHISKKPVIIQE
jgi:CBS domain containing-hemolysin-like protein